MTDEERERAWRKRERTWLGNYYWVKLVAAGLSCPLYVVWGMCETHWPDRTFKLADGVRYPNDPGDLRVLVDAETGETAHDILQAEREEYECCAGLNHEEREERNVAGKVRDVSWRQEVAWKLVQIHGYWMDQVAAGDCGTVEIVLKMCEAYWPGRRFKIADGAGDLATLRDIVDAETGETAHEMYRIATDDQIQEEWMAAWGNQRALDELVRFLDRHAEMVARRLEEKKAKARR